MDSDDHVSVIIPTWNRGNTIRTAIESALAQTHSVLEVLVCDDGSNDETSQIVEQLRANDSRVRWVSGARAGRPAIPRNRGIRLSHGRWIAFLDSDDAWLPTKLAEQLAAAKKLGCRAVCSNAYRVLPNGNEEGLLLGWNKPRLNLSDLLRTNWVICSSSMLDRSLLDAVGGGFPEEAGFRAIEDYALWLRVSTMTDFAYCLAPLVRYYDAPASSIRATQEHSPAHQRGMVLKNALTWLLRERPFNLPALFWVALAMYRHRNAR